MKKLHTAGPWKVNVSWWLNGTLNGTPTVYAPNGPDGGRHVCELYNNGNIEGNGRLIEQAPAMLEVLEAVEKWAMLTQTDWIPWLESVSAILSSIGRNR